MALDPRRWRAAVLALGAGLALAFVGAATPPAERLEGWLGDILARATAPAVATHDTIVFDVDDASLANLAPLVGPWPYRRDVWAHVVDYLTASGTTHIVIDVVLSDARPGDEQLRLALDRSPDTVLAGVAVPYPLTGDTAGSAAMAGLGWKLPAGVPARPAADMVAPRPEFRRPGRIGIATVVPDADGVVRRLTALHRIGDAYVPAVPLAALSTGSPFVGWTGGRGGGTLTVNGTTLALDGDGQAELWYPRAITGLPSASFARLARAALTSTADPDLVALIKGRQVFLGATALLLDDAIETPRGRLPGVEFVRLATSLVRQGAVLQPRSWLWDALLIYVAMLAALLVGGTAPESARRLGLALAAGASTVIVAALALLGGLQQRVWVLGPLLAAVGVVGGLGLFALRQLRDQHRHLITERLAADRALQLKTQFLNHVAHELRTPVAAMLGFSRLLTQEGGSTADRDEYARVILRNGGHLLRLVNNLLDDARLAAGRAQCDRHPTSVRQVVRDVVATMEGLPRGAGVEIVADIDATVPDRVMGDELRVRQVVLNLVANAAKFTERGRIHVRAAWQANQLTIAVEDTGPGIAPDALDRIFEEFEFGAASAARAGGTGLGLSVSRRLARLMGGDLTVRSEVGSGSRFALAIPAPAAPADLPPPSGRAGDPVAAVAAAQSQLGGWTPSVLVCDDAEDIRQLFAVVLERAGAHVLTAGDGAQAVEIVRTLAPDAVLLDLDLPALDGAAAMERMRAGGYAGPIVAVSGGSEAQVADLRERGFTDVAEKPISGAVLVDSLARLLPRWHPRRRPG